MRARLPLTRNRATEQDVRDYLTKHGYDGTSAYFHDLELAAIERPGWVQVFQFSLRVLDDSNASHELFGVVREDERHAIRVFVSHDEDDQLRMLDEWSDGLITLRRNRSRLTPIFLAMFAIAIGAALASALMRLR